jgi:hypothetical protein
LSKLPAFGTQRVANRRSESHFLIPKFLKLPARLFSRSSFGRAGLAPGEIQTGDDSRGNFGVRVVREWPGAAGAGCVTNIH